MRICSVHRFTQTAPDDLSQLKDAIGSGKLDPAEIVAVIGKTQGNGGINDFTRGFFTQSLFLHLAQHLGQPAHQLQQNIPCVLSGGTEGVLCPHHSVFTVSHQDPDATIATGPRLAIGRALSRPLETAEIGMMAQVRLCAEAVRTAMADAALDATEVAFAQLKVPAPTAQALASVAIGGRTPCSLDPKRAMALARVAAAWGVGVALGELTLEDLNEDQMLQDTSRFSTKASISSGVEVDCAEVVVLGNSEQWGGHLRIASAPMADALCLAGPLNALEALGLGRILPLPPEQRERIRAVFVKGEPDRSGTLRGNPHTMLNDTDIDPQRHIRGALGGAVGAVVGDGRIFVSGGAEHQGPDGGGLIAIIAEAH